MSEQKYLSGLYANKKHEKAPDFVICNLSVKPSALIESLRPFADMDGYLKLQVTTPYEEDAKFPDRLSVKIDSRERQKPPEFQNAPKTEDFDDDIPF